jgi:hypothetical protein
MYVSTIPIGRIDFNTLLRFFNVGGISRVRMSGIGNISLC